MQRDPAVRPIAVPVDADPVASPIVSHGDGPASINLAMRDGRWARATFEKLDSIRVSRGEYEPYPSSWRPEDPIYWVSIVEWSPWLRERYEYEKRHYGAAYGFGGDVEEMQHDFSHYLFRFHDEYVEALCAGIWFETADHPIGNRAPDADHPLLDLSPSPEPDRVEAHGLTCQVRRNHRPLNEILERARLCSQKLIQFAAELDGTANVHWTLSVRARDGGVRSKLEQRFGRAVDHFDGVATLEDVRPRIAGWLREVKDRRRDLH